MNNRIANDLIRYAELVEDGALISPEEMNCASLMRLAAEALMSFQDGAQPAVAEQHKHSAQHGEPVVPRFNEWTVGKNDLSDHIYVGELILAGIEDNLEEPEFGEVEIERFDAVIEALQEKLVTGRECKKVPLIAYIGANNTTPYVATPQSQRKPLTDEEIMNIAKVSCIGISPHEDTLNFAKVIEAVHGIKEKNNGS